MSDINQHNQPNTQGFYGLGIAPKFLDILQKLNFTSPTPIQTQAIPIAVEGKDMVGIAQTGTGKTLAFGIPMLQRLTQVKGRGLILLPTRELAVQVDEALMSIGRGMGLRTAVIIGGGSFEGQVKSLRKNPDIVVATPGRLIDHLNRKSIQLNSVAILVLDEADRMLDMGFAPQIKKILQAVPKDRQTMLFSATMPHEIMKIAAEHMKLPVRIEIAPAGSIADKVTQELFIVPSAQKTALLTKVLESHQGSTLVFTKTKHGAKKVTRQMAALGISTAEIHSNRSLNQRREALEGFRSGKYRVLVATDIASRGIDVVGIELVVNYDLPTTSDNYVHRIGRTARAGSSGHAITFATPDELREIRSIERLIRKSLPISKLPAGLPVQVGQANSFAPRPMRPSRPSGPRRFYRRRGYRT